MHNKIIGLDLNKCILIIEDDIDSNGVGYCCIIKCPSGMLNKLSEYAVSMLFAKGAETVMLGFKNNIFKPIQIGSTLGNLRIKHSYTMLHMKKKMSSQEKIKYNRDIKLKKIDTAYIHEYVQLYNEIFKDVPNAAIYKNEDVLKLLKQKNYDICFAYHKQKIVGLCEYQITPNEAIIETIGINKTDRNKGYAKSLLNNLYYIFQTENVKIISLTTSNLNKNAIKLYKQEGFVVKEILSYWYKIVN